MENVDIYEKISINLKQQIETKLISLFLFTVLFSHSPFPIPAVSDFLIVSQNNKKNCLVHQRPTFTSCAVFWRVRRESV